MERLIPILTLVVSFAFLYLILIIPEKKRRKKYNNMLQELKVNDEVMTRGGVIGIITSMKEDYVILQTGPDKARIKFSKNAIGSIINNTEEK
ncbi:preprotein translocase subunit YajC [Haloimpatiens sp. FM7315]|uniref:preprotein translocase subunit YajC n=1 Tax=Haloimpatiens sp. FM7315 TaxID=3298609 RepID=UPI003709DA65